MGHAHPLIYYRLNRHDSFIVRSRPLTPCIQGIMHGRMHAWWTTHRICALESTIESPSCRNSSLSTVETSQREKSTKIEICNRRHLHRHHIRRHLHHNCSRGLHHNCRHHDRHSCCRHGRHHRSHHHRGRLAGDRRSIKSRGYEWGMHAEGCIACYPHAGWGTHVGWGLGGRICSKHLVLPSD